MRRKEPASRLTSCGNVWILGQVSTKTANATTRRIPELDGLRGVAISLVLVWHYFVGQVLSEGGAFRFEAGTLPALLAVLGRLTWSGVDLFFVLSGFLIGGILLDARDDPDYFGSFYTRRFFRIIPIYAALLMLFGLAGYVPGLQSYSQWIFPWYAYATFTQNFWMAAAGTFGTNWLGPTWSLAVEEQFYLTLPLLIRYVRSRVLLARVLVAIAVAAPMLRVLLYLLHPQGEFASSVLMLSRADALALGVLGAMAVRDRGIRNFLCRGRGLFLVALAVGSLGLAVLTAHNWTIFTFPMALLGHSWLAAFYLCLMLFVVLHPQSALGGIMRNRVLTQLGQIAYGTYLLHVLLLSACLGLARSRGVPNDNLFNGFVVLLALSLTLAIAKISWMYFERPLIGLGRRLLSKVEKGASKNP